MSGRLLTAWVGAMGLVLSGCLATGPLIDNPVLVRSEGLIPVGNPVWVPQGPNSYGLVFEEVLSVLREYFVIASANRYEGRILTHPRIAPGYEQIFKPGSPDFDGRLLATLQTIRHYAEVKITEAPDGGFFVEVRVFQELEDLSQPTHSTAGAAVFQGDNTVERQFEVIEPSFLGPTNWIPLGRDEPLEQVILQRLKGCL